MKTPSPGGTPIEAAEGETELRTFHGALLLATEQGGLWEVWVCTGSGTYKAPAEGPAMWLMACKLVADRLLHAAHPLPEVRPDNVALYCVETPRGDIFLVLQEDGGSWVTAHGSYRAEGDTAAGSLDLMLRATHSVNTGDSSLGTFQLDFREGEAPSLLWVTEVAP